MKRHFKRALILIVLLLIASPCIFCFWIAFGENIWIQLSLRLYPGLQSLGDDYQYFGADSGEKISYYWTTDSIEKVETYYSNFTFPFVDDPYKEFTRLTVFNIRGTELKVYSVDGSSRLFNYPEDTYCDYKQTYQCVNIRLRDLTTHPMNGSPILVSPPSLKYATGAAPALVPDNGTLVAYSYFVWDP
jgi:hypothetical protein